MPEVATLISKVYGVRLRYYAKFRVSLKPVCDCFDCIEKFEILDKFAEKSRRLHVILLWFSLSNSRFVSFLFLRTCIWLGSLFFYTRGRFFSTYGR